jgi:hypothetical protein
MFLRTKHLQYAVRMDKPNPMLARQVQEQVTPLPPGPAKIYDNLSGDPTGRVEKPAPAQAGSLLGKLEGKLTGGS